jgi:hypothetical protein
MSELAADLGRWGLDERGVRERLYGASTARERERWHDGRALRVGGLLGQGWPAAQVATALERDPHTVGEWLDGIRRSGPAGLTFERTGGPPPPSTRASGRR